MQKIQLCEILTFCNQRKLSNGGGRKRREREGEREREREGEREREREKENLSWEKKSGASGQCLKALFVRKYYLVFLFQSFRDQHAEKKRLWHSEKDKDIETDRKSKI